MSKHVGSVIIYKLFVIVLLLVILQNKKMENIAMLLFRALLQFVDANLRFQWLISYRQQPSLL